jgi:hypothetical protein
LATPLQVNESLKDDEPVIDFSNIFGAFDDVEDPALKTKIEELKALLNLQIHTFDVDTEKVKPKDIEQILKFVPAINEPVSVNDFLAKLNTLNSELVDKEKFKNIRRYNLENLPSFNQMKETNLRAINTVLLASPLKKDLNTLIDDQNQSEKGATFDQQVSGAFFILNLFGLDQEKNKKADFTSLSNDSQHAFYAAYCDILISEDEGLRIKSKAVYENYKIPTLVFSVGEFINYFKGRVAAREYSLVDFINSLYTEINDDNFLYDYVSTQFNRITKYYKPKETYFDYFNLLEYLDDKDTGRAIVLAPDRNLSLFYDEFKFILNKIVSCFGIDLKGNGEFTETDHQEILGKKWEGRIWGISGIAVYLEINSGTNKLSIVIEEIKK